MSNIIIISVFGSIGESNSRLNNIINIFNNHNEIIITTDFNHGEKRRKEINCNQQANGCSVIQIHVPEYKSNLSVARIWSHLIFSFRLYKKLKDLNVKPDFIYCTMPTSSSAYVAGKYCKKRNIPFIIDVIDLWPDSLIPIMSYKRIVDFLVSPWRWVTHKSYKMADYISGESKKYAEIAHFINPDVPYSYTYLGVDIDSINKLIEKSEVSLVKPKNEIWIAYGGSLGQSYDFDVILEGVKYLKEKNIRYKMWFIGDGEKADNIEKYAQRNNLNIEITGRMPYQDLLKYLSYCDIAINSFKEGTNVVHSYKFNDYVATGCYVLNNLAGETSEMIDKYEIGANFNSTTFDKVLYDTVIDWNNIKPTLPVNLKRVIDEELDSSIIYGKLKMDINEKVLIYKSDI